MFAVHSIAVGDRLYRETHDEAQALTDAVNHVLDNGAGAEVRDDDGRVRWYVTPRDDSTIVEVERV